MKTSRIVLRGRLPTMADAAEQLGATPEEIEHAKEAIASRTGKRASLTDMIAAQKRLLAKRKEIVGAKELIPSKAGKRVGQRRVVYVGGKRSKWTTPKVGEVVYVGGKWSKWTTPKGGEVAYAPERKTTKLRAGEKIDSP